MKKINFEFPKRKEQFKIASIVIRSLGNNNTIVLKRCFAKPLFNFMSEMCMCRMQSTNEKDINQIVIIDPEARFIPGDNCVIFEVLLSDTDKGRVIIEEE